MKKSNFVALVLGTVSGILFSLGICMVLLPEWNALRPGVILGCAGVIMALISILVWRKMENKEPIKFNGKTVRTAIVALVGTVAFGIGMVNVMVWAHLLVGIIIGLLGIIILLMLIPLCMGLK